MNRRTVFQVLVLVLVVPALGCSKGGNTPLTPNDLTANKATTGTPSQTHLWGYYDVYVDIPTKTATAVPNRGVMFAANVTQYLNGKASNLGFDSTENFSCLPLINGGLFYAAGIR